MFVGLGLAWWAVTGPGLVQPIFLPSPGSVATRSPSSRPTASSCWTSGLDVPHFHRLPDRHRAGDSDRRPDRRYRSWEAAIEPLVDFIRYMPVVAFVPLTILWAGTDDSQKFLIIFIGTFFQQVLLIMDNVKRVPRDFVDIGRTLGMKDRAILRRSWCRPRPGDLGPMRISLGWAWTWLVLAELVAATPGSATGSRPPSASSRPTRSSATSFCSGCSGSSSTRP